MKGAVGLSLLLVGLALIMLAAGAVVILTGSDGETVEPDLLPRDWEPGSGGGRQPSGPELEAADQGAPDADPSLTAEAGTSEESPAAGKTGSISIAGRFLTPDGHPLAGVAVTTTPALGPTPAMTRADGTFSALLPVDPGGDAIRVYFTASRGGFADVYRQGQAKSGGSIDLGNVVMPMAAAAPGRNPADPRAAGAVGRQPGRDPSARLPDRQRPGGQRQPRRPDERRRRNQDRPDGDTPERPDGGGLPRNP